MEKTLPDTHTITLRRPVEFAGETWSVLRLREPTVGEIEEVQALGAVDGIAHLLFLITGLPPGAIDQIGERDLRQAETYLAAICKAPAAMRDPPDTLVVRLRKPLTDDQGSEFELNLREPRLSDLRRVETMNAVTEMKTMIALVTGIAVERIARIGVRDYRAAEAYLRAFS
jgi:hypothetical protein